MMLLSVALILLVGFLLGEIFERLKLPRLLGMLLCGILLGPSVFNCIDVSILSISGELRKIALLMILLKAGLGLNLSDLKRAGRPALLLSFLPASFEIFSYILLAPAFLGISRLQAAVLGCVIASVSPAVLVPKMSALMEENWGTKKAIPQMLLAGASVDDVFVIVLFTLFSQMEVSGRFAPSILLRIPTSILLGLTLGIAAGALLGFLFQRVHLRDSAKIVVLLGISLLFVVLEDRLSGPVAVSGLLAVMTMGITLRLKLPLVSVRLGGKFSRLWVAAEIFLFVLVGANVEVSYLSEAGFGILGMLMVGLLIRSLGVWLAVMKTPLNRKERLFVMLAELPKATVQAAIGGIPLALGSLQGQMILTAAVVSILICAPLGAVAIERTYPNLLTQDADIAQSEELSGK